MYLQKCAHKVFSSKIITIAVYNIMFVSRMSPSWKIASLVRAIGGMADNFFSCCPRAAYGFEIGFQELRRYLFSTRSERYNRISVCDSLAAVFAAFLFFRSNRALPDGRSRLATTLAQHALFAHGHSVSSSFPPERGDRTSAYRYFYGARGETSNFLDDRRAWEKKITY